MSDPKYLYKILDSPTEHPLPAKLPATELDTKDGFIHLSTAKQVPSTANLFFSTFSKLWIVQLRPQDLDGETKYPSDLPECAHLHGSQRGLGKSNIEAVIEVEKGSHSEWKAVPEICNLVY